MPSFKKSISDLMLTTAMMGAIGGSYIGGGSYKKPQSTLNGKDIRKRKVANRIKKQSRKKNR